MALWTPRFYMIANRNMTDRAVFFDPSRRRWWWVKRLVTLLGLASAVTVSVWLISLFTVPLLPGVLGLTLPITRSIRRSLHFPRHDSRLRQFQLKRTRDLLLTQVAKDRVQKQAREALPPVSGASGVVAAFYAPWQETGLHSLRANASRMTHVLPAWVHLSEDARSLDFHDWDPVLTPHNNDVLEVARTNNLNIMPVFSNAQISSSGSGEFDPKRVHVFLSDPALQQKIIVELRKWILQNRFQGVNIDFENLQDADYPLMIPFLQRIKTAFAPNLQVSIDLEANKPLNWKQASSLCDFVIVMAYDEHSQTDAKPGPIASMNWYRGVLQRALNSQIPRDKLVVGLANYAYDWTIGRDGGEPQTYQGALLLAQKYRIDAREPGVVPEKAEDVIDFDANYLNPTFWYVDDAGKDHEVWMLDAVTAANQWLVASNYGVRGVAVWVLGSNDPSIWTFIHRDRLNQPPNMGVLRKITFPYEVDFVGEGEIAHVEALPTDGSRTMEIDPATGLAIDESYHHFPTSFVIARSGYRPKMLALTIDDGPASPYTDQLLDVLKQENVKATFFLIGQNAERYPQLVRRIWAEGHEIGNHSYTHPNIGAIPERQARLELNATQRVFQSLLHRSTLLFRPPYNADAEPTSAEEVKPVVLASNLNYITVLEFLDPQDWNTEERLPNGQLHHRTAQDMLATLESQLDLEHGSCILLHDGGGDRTETIKLVPMLIRDLRAKGYTFVPVSTLINSTRDLINPPVTKSDTLMLANDRVVFEAIYLFELFLSVAFVSAIILGTIRVIFVTILAIIARLRERKAVFDETYSPALSVVIAAYNEGKVINRTIQSVLDNGYPTLEVIVVDDGSVDDTSEQVVAAFGSHPSVRLLRQENGGKASALNRGHRHRQWRDHHRP
jgi:Predicted glycosyl hydrolase